MTRSELQQLIADVQKRQSELANVEVKAARRGTPRRLFEPFSAFANRTGGGVLLFGLDESSDFSIVGVGMCKDCRRRSPILPLRRWNRP